MAINKRFIMALLGGIVLFQLLATILPKTSVANMLQSENVPFGDDGIVLTDFSPDWIGAHNLTLQPDEKFIVVGNIYTSSDARMLIVRYTPTGQLDSTFGNNGIVIIDLGHQAAFSAARIQEDGKIIAVGKIGEDLGLVRFNEDGSLDTSFNHTGVVTTSFGINAGGSDLAIQSDGKITVAAWTKADWNIPGNFALSRYHADGSPDISLNSTGVITHDLGGDDTASAIALQADNKIVLAGHSDNNFAVVRYNIDGSLDTSFNSTGIVITDLGILSRARDLVIQPDNKILSVGQGATLIRYSPDGSLDTSFDNDGIITDVFNGQAGSAHRVALQENGKIVVLGTTNTGEFAVARYEDDGILDINFGTTGIVITELYYDDTATGLIIQPDGKIVASGYSGNSIIGLVRYLDNGDLDAYAHRTYLPMLIKN